jgi:hypothetical protein
MWLIYVILVLLFLYFVYIYYSLQMSLMNGLWMCDPSFCADAGIQSMYVMVGKRKICVVISMEGKVVHEETFDYWYIFRPYNTFSFYIHPKSDLFPERMLVEAKLKEGTMTWSDETSVQARLIRTFL